MANRLANETSPYLLQHKDNPVDWYPWGNDAFTIARQQDKPIILSIGYSSCHWCHVMAHESFEDDSIAAEMNRDFINIKVDREELPDVDSIYMRAVQAMTGSGGWPLTLFITPDGRPFFGGTYFPPEDRHNMPGFPRILSAISTAYTSNRDQLLSNSEQVIEAIRKQTIPQKHDGEIKESLIFGAFNHLIGDADLENGGTRGAPKFPQPMFYELLLRYWKRTGSAQILAMVTLTLEKMARGGIYDQLGGGFSRYSVDDRWEIPHFEKMLYDNAQLVRLYLHAYQVTKKPLFRRVVRETIEYVTREMTHREGGFYSASDADSEGVEGKFFVWSVDEIDAALTEEDAELAKLFWGVTEQGNFEDSNTLTVPVSLEEFVAGSGRDPGELISDITRVRGILFDQRSKRVPPSTDDKILTSWNALMLSALAEAGAVLDNNEWIESAQRNAKFLLTEMRDSSGRLLHTWRATDGTKGEAKIPAYLDDYSYMIDALLTLHGATLNYSYVDEAQELAQQMIERFWDRDSEVFYDTSMEHTRLLLRPRDVLDNAVPSGGAVAAMAMLRLSVFTGDHSYSAKAEASIRSVLPYLEQAPTAVTSWLSAVDFLTAKRQETVVMGALDDPVVRDLMREVNRQYSPNMILSGSSMEPDQNAKAPMLQGRALVNGKPTVFVCENYVCNLPVTSVAELAELLSSDV